MSTIETIAEIVYNITNEHSSCIETKYMWQLPGFDNEDLTLEEFIEQNISYLQEQWEKKLSQDSLTVEHAINIIWEMATYYFLCHIFTVSPKKDFSNVEAYLRTKLSSILKRLFKKYPIPTEWIDWQYKQLPYEEFLKRYPYYYDSYGFHPNERIKEVDKETRRKMKEEAFEYTLAKATPCIKSAWLDERLKSFKTFAETGESDENFFPYHLYLLLTVPDFSFPKATAGVRENEIKAIKQLASFAAYIDNIEELSDNINNFIVDYFFYFVRNEHSARKEFDYWGDSSTHIANSCAHQNEKGDLYTKLKSISDLAAWLQLANFLDIVPIDEIYIVYRCFGLRYSNYFLPDTAFFSNYYRNTIKRQSRIFKGKAGLALCQYWFMHLLSYNDFKDCFYEDEQILTDAFADDHEMQAKCEELGIQAIKPKAFQKDSLNILQQHLFFVLYHLTARTEEGFYSRKFVLAPLMKKIVDGSWCKKETILEIYNELLCKRNSPTKLNWLFDNLENSTEPTCAAITLIYNMANFLHKDSDYLVKEINYIKEDVDSKLNIPEHVKLKKKLNDGKYSEAKQKEIQNNQKILSCIDSGLTIPVFMQKVPNFKNLYISRPISMKVFLDSDCDAFKEDDVFFRTQYKNLFKNKYLYFDRNIATHYATFSKIDDLFKPNNFADFLTAIYDLKENCNDINFHIREDVKFSGLDQIPYFKNILNKWFAKLDVFCKSQDGNITELFDSEHKCTIERNKLRNKFGEEFWKSCNLDKKQLTDCLNALYGNTPIFRLHREQKDEKGNIVSASYGDHESEFLNAYSTDIAIYLIKIAIELMQTKETSIKYFNITCE